MSSTYLKVSKRRLNIGTEDITCAKLTARNERDLHHQPLESSLDNLPVSSWCFLFGCFGLLSELMHFGAKETTKAVTSFGKMKSGGVAGLSADHLQYAIAEYPSLKDSLAEYVTSVANSGYPPKAQRFFAGGALTGLNKPGGDIRPIACGEFLRRLVGKVLAARATKSKRVKDAFKGVQYGCGAPLGTDSCSICNRASGPSGPEVLAPLRPKGEDHGLRGCQGG